MIEKISAEQVTRHAARIALVITLLAGSALLNGHAQAQTQGPSPAAAQTPPRTGGGMAGAVPQLSKLTLPPGFSAAVFAQGVQGARSMALAPDGTLFVGTRGNKLYAVIDADNDHAAEKVVELASNLRTPNGVAFKDGALYVGELNRIVRFDGVLDAVKSGSGSGLTPKVVLDGLPSETMHGWKYIAFGPDGYLYYQIGAPCNVCDRGEPFASIWRVKPDGTGNEVFARGVRNSVGMAWHPDTKELWFTENGRDMLGDEQPNDELNHAAKTGLHFGYPHATGAPSRTRSSVPPTRARTTNRRRRSSDPTSRRLASRSTPAACFPPSTAIACSSRSTGRGIAPRRPARSAIAS